MLFTANELGEKLNYNATTIRTWGRKPVPGKVFDPEYVNIEYIRAQLLKVFTADEIVEKLGCPVDEVEMTKAIRSAGDSSSKIKIEDMVVGSKYVLISHVYKHEVELVGIATVEDQPVYIFRNLKEYKSTQDRYRALSHAELSTDRWTIKKA